MTRAEARDALLTIAVGESSKVNGSHVRRVEYHRYSVNGGASCTAETAAWMLSSKR